MNRRGFLGVVLATGCAPAIVRAESLMRIVVPTVEETLLFGLPRTTPLEFFGEDTFTQIVMTTLRSRKEQIVAEIFARNAFLLRLRVQP